MWSKKKNHKQKWTPTSSSLLSSRREIWESKSCLRWLKQSDSQLTHGITQAQAVVKGSLAKENKGCSFERNTVKSMLMGGIYFPPVLSSGHKPKVCFSEAFLRELLRRLAPALAGSQPLSPPSAEAPRVLLHSEGSKEGLYLCLVQPKEPQCGRRQKGTPPEEADPG